MSRRARQRPDKRAQDWTENEPDDAFARIDDELEQQTGEPHVDGWPLYSMIPEPVERREVQ